MWISRHLSLTIDDSSWLFPFDYAQGGLTEPFVVKTYLKKQTQFAGLPPETRSSKSEILNHVKQSQFKINSVHLWLKPSQKFTKMHKVLQKCIKIHKNGAKIRISPVPFVKTKPIYSF